jgi:hypothetical protein
MSRPIHLSDKHGVNPAIPLCFFCGEKKNEVILAGRMPGDAEAPQNAVWNYEPCDSCAKLMAQGVILISAADEGPSSNPESARRTGGWCVVSDAFVQRVLQPEEMVKQTLSKRAAFLSDEAWDALGLPRGTDHLTRQCETCQAGTDAEVCPLCGKPTTERS